MRQLLLAAALAASVVLLTSLAARPALAVAQPDGTVIPQGPEVQDLFTSRGEALNALTDGATTPERFVPGCTLTFTLVSRGPATFHNAFGWYNVTGSAPAESDLHVLVPCDAPDNFVATLDLRSEPAYRGGEVGFFLRTPEDPNAPRACTGEDCCARAGHPGRTYYTERAYNPDNRGADAYIHLLIYDSRVTPQSFYFAWEDLFAGGDNQFTDFVAQVGNIVCAGAGAPCETGMPGVCGAGTRQCRSGLLQCVGASGPSAERCDGLDNDCDGTPDDGDGLCPADQLCERGTCVGRCVEQSCFSNEVCTARGACVETACASVVCPATQRCVGGRCVGACEGVRCPGSQTCVGGRCVDPCATMNCETGQVCVAGICQTRCPCRRCGASETCGTDGVCTANACMGVTCQPGQTCVAGVCHDDCDGATCPRGERCERGACVDGAASPDAGTGIDGSVRGDARADARGGDGGGAGGTSGCACRAAGPAPGATRAGWLLGALGAAALMRRRRRDRRASPRS